MKQVNYEEVKNLYLKLVVVHFDLDDPHDETLNNAKRDVTNILEGFEELLDINNE